MKSPEIIKHSGVEPRQQILYPRLKIPGTTSVERAREILGKNMYGVEDFCTAYNLPTYHTEEIPPIMATEIELEKAGKQGLKLIFCKSNFPDGSPVTMQNMRKRNSNKKTTDYGLLSGRLTPGISYSGENWYERKKCPFYFEETLQEGWLLTSGEPLSETLEYSDAFEQLIYLIGSVKKMWNLDVMNFDGNADNNRYQHAIEEWNAKRTEIMRAMVQFQMARTTMAFDVGTRPSTSVEKLMSQLQVNKLFRPTPVEALHIIAMDYARLTNPANNHEEEMLGYFADVSTITSAISPLESLVTIGHVDFGGARVNVWEHEDRPPRTGSTLVMRLGEREETEYRINEPQGNRVMAIKLRNSF